MNQAKRRVGAVDIVLTALSALLLIGVLTFFKPCAAHEDGSWMTCHWAGQAVAGLGAALCLLCAARLFMGAQMKRGADVALILFAALAAAVPGGLINLCMMAGMRCRALTRPAVMVVSALIAVVAAVDLLLKKKER